MQLAVSIEGREVLASGVLVMGAGDRLALFDLDGMKFAVTLVPDIGDLAVSFIRNDTKDMTIELRGRFPEFTAAWKLAGIAQAADRMIDLDLIIYSQTDAPQSVRQLSFSFTAHPGMIGAPPQERAIPR